MLSALERVEWDGRKIVHRLQRKSRLGGKVMFVILEKSFRGKGRGGSRRGMHATGCVEVRVVVGRVSSENL